MLFDTIKELDGIVESLLVASGANIFAQSVNHKTNGIKLLFGVLGITLVVERPISAAIFAVDEMGNDIVLGSRCHFKILGFAENAICSRESPQDTTIEYAALFGIGVQVAMTVNTAIESTVLAVNHIVNPEGQDVACEHILHFLLEC